MKLKNLRQVLWLFVFMLTGIAYGKEYQKTRNGLKADIDDIQVEIQFYSQGIVRILKYPQGEVVDKKSFSVIKTPENIPFSVEEDRGAVLLKSDSLKVKLDLQT